jgi:hypothetical protein
MAWETSDRSDRLPSNWRTIRRRILERDGWRCTAVDLGRRCPEPATEVHHFVNRDIHDDDALVSLCARHHRVETQREAAQARHRITRIRPTEQHPGLIR